jgi:AraC family transcriptional regulator
MLTVRTLAHGPISVAAYVCKADSTERPFVEQHQAWSVSYVHRGSFSCACQGRRVELVPGSVLLGRPDDEYKCAHDHHRGGDECLAFFIEPALADEMGGRHGVWQSGGLPPIAELIVLGELARSAAHRHHGPRVDEVGMAFATKVVDLIEGQDRPRARPRSADQRRAIEAAHWIDAHAADDIDLQVLARQASLSVYHYLRVFSAVLGITPHQYLLRCRLRRAAQLLADEDRPVTDIALEVGFADLSNFVRSFRRASGVSPLAYRRTARGDRKILQVRIGTNT